MKTKRVKALLLALALVLAALPLSGCGAAASGETGGAEYAEKIFDTSRVHTIDVAISDEDWADLTANPLEKTKYHTTVTIDGEEFQDVSFATKGNTSLSFVAMNRESDRYSFKLNFGKFAEGQTYYGLDKLNLNNIYADATYLKDYLSYEIMCQAGAGAPLCSYVWLTLNGEDHGLYLAIEEVGRSWLDRSAGGEGQLYKPETDRLDNADRGGGMPGGAGFPSDGNMGFPGFGGMGIPSDGGMNFPGFGGGPTGTPSDGNVGFPGFGGMGFPSDGAVPDGGFFRPGERMMSSDGTERRRGGDREGGPFGGGGFEEDAAGADLRYTDDSPESYSAIFDNAETGADEADMARVIAALKGLAGGTDLDRYLDTDGVIRYFAAHNFVLNYDSYTGNMLHNYYLYERDGKLSMLPWDYNLAFGGFSGGMGRNSGSGATALVNTGIDTPLSGTTEEARPMWAWIVSDAAYREEYHQVLDGLLTGYFESGAFERELDALHDLLLPYIEKDPTAFFTAEEFEKGYETLLQFCQLRAQSIRAQLDGGLAASTDEQDAESRVDASGLTIQDMGSQGGGPDGDRDGGPGGNGGGFGGFGGERGGNGRRDGFTPVS